MNVIKILSFLLLSFSIAILSCSKSDDTDTGGDGMEMMEDNNNDDGNALEDAPDFSLETTDGSSISSAQFEGKNLVIFFFGAECGPCRAIGPDVEEKLYQAFKNNDKFAMIGADQWDRNNATVDDFVETTGITFQVGTMGSSMASDFKTTYDRLVVVNSDGKIVFKGSNRVHNHLDEGIKAVQDLL